MICALYYRGDDLKYEGYTCIDAGSKYCPCSLADTGDCIVCSQLQGKEKCDCQNWSGTCIYQDYIMNNKKTQDKRLYYNGVIMTKEHISDNVIQLNVQTSLKLLENLIFPGSFVFLRHPEMNKDFDFPTSVMDVCFDTRTIKFVFEVQGPKTKTINAIEVGNKILLRGPYWNGILGVEYINKIINSNVLLVIKGIHQVPAVSVIKKLISNNNNISIILDPNKVKNVFIKEYINHDKINLNLVSIMKDNEIDIYFKEILKEYVNDKNLELVFLGTSDYLTNILINYISQLNKEIKLSSTNNHKMVCGEGICGSCTIINKDLKLRRMCKMQTKPEFIFERREIN